MSWIDGLIEKGLEVDYNNVEHINLISSGHEGEVGNLPSLLIEDFKKYFPNINISWNAGCSIFYFNGVGYGTHLNFYWLNKAPRFYKLK